MNTYPKRRITVRAIAYHGGKIFCQVLKNNKFWCTPGGGLDLGESLHDGLVREMIEETGVKVEVGKLLFTQQYTEHNPDGSTTDMTEFFFAINNPEDLVNYDKNASHYDIEIHKCDFVDPKTTNILPKFLTEVDIEKYINDCLPVKNFDNLNEEKLK